MKADQPSKKKTTGKKRKKAGTAPGKTPAPVKAKKIAQPGSPKITAASRKVSSSAKKKAPAAKTTQAKKTSAAARKNAPKAGAVPAPAKSGRKKQIRRRPPSDRQAKEKTLRQLPLPDKRVKRFPLLSGHELPREYGEDDLLTVVVDPDVVFADWEIRPGHLAGRDGDLCLRVYDVTAGGNGSSGHYFDISIQNRIGSDFLRLGMQGREVVLAIGLLAAQGKFRTIISSRRLSIPPHFFPQEYKTPVTRSESDRPVGY